MSRKAWPGLTPKWTVYNDDAERWIEEGKKVVCRTILNGHGGAGIVIAASVDELVDAPLYVQYIPKKAEYRVHVFNGDDGEQYWTEIIDIQRKIKKPGEEPLDWQIRSHDNGFIYVRENIEPIPQCVRDVAWRCFRETNLHFGAVDVIYNERQDRAYVLEINTAPGLEGQTVSSYANAFRDFTRRIR